LPVGDSGRTGRGGALVVVPAVTPAGAPTVAGACAVRLSGPPERAAGVSIGRAAGASTDGRPEEMTRSWVDSA
jgi:hypothetical protein